MVRRRPREDAWYGVQKILQEPLRIWKSLLLASVLRIRCCAQYPQLQTSSTEPCQRHRACSMRIIVRRTPCFSFSEACGESCPKTLPANRCLWAASELLFPALSNDPQDAIKIFPYLLRVDTDAEVLRDLVEPIISGFRSFLHEFFEKTLAQQPGFERGLRKFGLDLWVFPHYVERTVSLRRIYTTPAVCRTSD
jgi:hypothetical protein